MDPYILYLFGITVFTGLFIAWSFVRLANRPTNPMLETTSTQSGLSFLLDPHIDNGRKMAYLGQLPIPLLIDCIQLGLDRLDFITLPTPYMIWRDLKSMGGELVPRRLPVVVEGALARAAGEPVLMGIQRYKGSQRLGLGHSYSRLSLGLFQQLCRKESSQGVYVYLGVDQQPPTWQDGVLVVPALALLQEISLVSDQVIR